jgi:hypothetical protein
LKKLLSSYWATMCYMLLLLTKVVFFREMHKFLQITWTGLLLANRTYLHLEKPNLQEVFPEKLTQFSRETML